MKLFVTALLLAAVEAGHKGKGSRRNWKCAKAEMVEANNSAVAGTVQFFQKDEDADTRIIAELSGVSPPGRHGFHIHENGALTNECADAGGHFNPDGFDHGAPTNDAADRHIGCLGNIYANPDGDATYFNYD